MDKVIVRIDYEMDRERAHAFYDQLLRASGQARKEANMPGSPQMLYVAFPETPGAELVLIEDEGE